MSDPNDTPRRYALVDADGSIEQEDTSSGDYVGDDANGVATDIDATGTNTGSSNDDGNPPTTSAKVGDTTDTAAVTGKPAAFILPNGEVMNCKNTLQSFDGVVERASPHQPQRRKKSATTESATDLQQQQEQHLSDLSYSHHHHDDDPTIIIHAQAIPMPSAIVVVAPPSIHHVAEAQVCDPETTNASTASTGIVRKYRTALLWFLSVIVVGAIAGISVYCGTGNCSTKSTLTSLNDESKPSPTVPFGIATTLPTVPNAPPSASNPPSTNTPDGDKQLSAACNFLSLTDLRTCLAATRIENGTPVVGNTIPTEIGLLTQLSALDLYSSQLNGTIPSALGNLLLLTYLDMSGNQLTGPIPSILGNLIQLTSLDVSDNQLTSTVPPILGNLVQLNWLDFAVNQFTGPIPSTLGNLVQLTTLWLNSNRLTGTIPSVLCSFSGIDLTVDCENIACACCTDRDGNKCPNRNEQLSVACNFLSLTDLTLCQARKIFNGQTLGNTIPTEIGLLTQLTSLDLSSSQLNGTIPSTLGNMGQLATLDLSLNQLTGPIPSALGNMLQLNYLALYDNQLNGTVPSTLGNLPQLTSFYLYSNQLTGTIPSTLGSLTQVSSMSLDNNQLTGTIPSTMGQMTQLNGLDLSDNQLIGTIPSTFGNLIQLETLDLSFNQLTGPIPSTFGNLLQLYVLAVYNNTRLSGTIPTTFCSSEYADYQIIIDCADNIECTCCTEFPVVNGSYEGRPQPCPST